MELLDRPDNSFYPKIFEENSYSQCCLDSSYTGRIKVTALFKSNGKHTPVLDPNVQLSVGNSKRTSFYTSKAFPFDVSAAKVVAMIDNYRPSNTAISLQIQIFTNFAENEYVWVDMVQNVNSNPLGNNWVETEYNLDLQNMSVTPDPMQSFSRVRINMSTSNDKDRPVVANLRLNTQKI
jgi:hypothetical protein